MATRYLEGEVLPTSSDTSVSDIFSVREAEINSHFDNLDKLLKDKRILLIDKLKEKRSEFEELENGRLTEINEIENIKLQMMSVGVKRNKVNVLREETVKLYDDALAKLRTPVQPPKIIFDNLTDQFTESVELMDLMFVEEDYLTVSEPTLSLHSDDIQSLQDINEKLVDQFTKPTKVIFGRIAVDSVTNRLFVLNLESENIIVFEQDGNIISCFGGNNGTPADLSIDNENDCIIVLCDKKKIVKFNLTDYELLVSKDITGTHEDAQIDEFTSIDNQKGQLYACPMIPYLCVFSSDLEFIRLISVDTVFNLSILCRNEDILVFSLLPSQMSIVSYNGDLIRRIPLYYQLNFERLEKLEAFPFQFYVDQYGLFVICNPSDSSLIIQTLSGTIVHKLVFPPEDDTIVHPIGVTSSKEGRIIVSLLNSKHPLRYFC